MYIFAKYRERRSMFVETEKNGDLLTKYTNGCNDYGRSNNTSARMLDCGCSCKRYIRDEFINTAFKIMFRVYVHKYHFLFFFTNKQDSKKGLRRYFPNNFYFFSFFLFFAAVHPPPATYPDVARFIACALRLSAWRYRRNAARNASMPRYH